MKSVVKAWVQDNFDLNEVDVVDSPLFPSGLRIIDKNGDEMIAFYDIMTDQVNTIFPSHRRK